MAERSVEACVKCDDQAVIYTPIGRLCPKHWTDYCQEAREARTPGGVATDDQGGGLEHG